MLKLFNYNLPLGLEGMPPSASSKEPVGGSNSNATDFIIMENNGKIIILRKFYSVSFVNRSK